MFDPDPKSAGKSRLRVLLIGATGVFGSRLARFVAQEHGIELILAARNLAKLETLADELSKRPHCIVLDRASLTAQDLTGYDLVIDAAGPFEADGMRVVESAIAAKTDYLDLADGRAFVSEFPRYDEVAKGAGVALITGASSIPALSHAVIDQLTSGWQAIETLKIGIFPGNRAPRGLSVIETILSYVGKPVRVFREGGWRNVSGWGMLHREPVPGLGRRWASVCDTPEQDLLVARYAPRKSAEFFAGLELPLLHLGLAALALPVRWGWLTSLRPLARPLRWLAQLFEPFGTDEGGMSVRASGRDANGRQVERAWSLTAIGGRGPNIPVLAALAMLRRYRAGKRPEPGARACSGILTLDDFAADFARLEISHGFSDQGVLQAPISSEPGTGAERAVMASA